MAWELSSGQRSNLITYAEATGAYFTHTNANNMALGFTHTSFGQGEGYLTWPGVKIIDTGGFFGSHVNINEVTLRFLSLAVEWKMDWLQYLPPSERYTNTWGQIRLGLETLRFMQQSTNTLLYASNTFHRTYWTALTWTSEGKGYYLDRVREDSDPDHCLRRDGKDEQSSDDNALAYMNLLVLEGLAIAGDIPVADRDEITNMCHQIRDDINLRRFLVNDVIVHQYTNGVANTNLYWDRLSAEGAPILAAMLLSTNITVTEFYRIADTLENTPVDWIYPPGTTNHIDRPSYHAAMFIHGLRAIHGMPVTSDEFPGVDFFETSLKPTFMTHMDYGAHHGYQALGSQVMSQALEDYPLLCEPAAPNNQVQFAGNENKNIPYYGTNLSRATGPHAWFIPLQRYRHLDSNTVDTLWNYVSAYTSEFFHAGFSTQLGWEAAIPWTPTDTNYTWIDSDGRTNFTNNGRPYEALNAAYTVLSIFDALSPTNPLASYNIEAERVGHIAAYLDSGIRLPVLVVNTEISQDYAVLSTTLTYTVTVSNTGLFVADGVELHYTVPISDVTVGTVSPGCTVTNGEVVCDIGDLPLNGSTQILVSVMLTNVTPIVALTNSAVVSTPSATSEVTSIIRNVTDHDGDGIPTFMESTSDGDGDGLPAYLDADDTFKITGIMGEPGTLVSNIFESVSGTVYRLQFATNLALPEPWIYVDGTVTAGLATTIFVDTNNWTDRRFFRVILTEPPSLP